MKPESKRTILIVGMGTTPAVLTNAVWALAHSCSLVLDTAQGGGILVK